MSDYIKLMKGIDDETYAGSLFLNDIADHGPLNIRNYEITDGEAVDIMFAAYTKRRALDEIERVAARNQDDGE